MTQTATRTTKSVTPSVIELEVGKPGQHVLDELANARQTRLEAERVETPLKDKLKEIYVSASDGLKLGDTLVIKACGVVRGRVTLRMRAKKVDLDLLREAWPEAYEACVQDVFSTQFDSA